MASTSAFLQTLICQEYHLKGSTALFSLQCCGKQGAWRQTQDLLVHQNHRRHLTCEAAGLQESRSPLKGFQTLFYVLPAPLQSFV